MAKTLIGNVRGKDGRGISKIEKTATNGSIDTYTITYTDNTTYTFDIKNSSDGAIQDLIISSSNVESTTTASRTYTKGTYVSVNGKLKKVTSTIGQGSQFNSTNSQDTTIADELKNGTGGSTGGESYSTSETLTGGTWIDGKPIYKKVIRQTNSGLNNTTKISHGISNIKEIVKVEGMFFDGGTWTPLPQPSADGSKIVGFRVDNSVIHIVGSDSYSQRSDRYLTVIIYYTKN